MLIFQLALIVLFSKIAGDMSVRLGQPSVLGKLLIGIVLGPSVLGLIQDTHILKEFSEIGVILLMFIAGLETDVNEFKKTGKASILVGVWGIILPMAGGFAAGKVMGLSDFQSVFLGLLLSATSVSISVQALKEMNRLKTKEGMTILGAAVIDDVLVIVALAFVMSLSVESVNMGLVIAKKLAFFAVAILLGIKAVPWVLRKFARLRVSESVISIGLILCFVFAAGAEFAGVAAIIGAYVAGAAIGLTEFREDVFEKVETISYAVFVPVFFTSIGVTVSFSGISGYIPLILALSVVAVMTKLIGSGIGARLSGFSLDSSLGIGSAMVSRGEVALIIAAIGLDNGLLEKDLMAVLVVVVLITTLITPPLLKRFFGKADAKAALKA